MNEKINLVEILKDAPNGLILYSPLFGDVKLQKSDRIPAMIEFNNNYPIIVETASNGTCDFDEYGRPAMYRNSDCECMLFPSKENRDWSRFKVPQKHKHFELFQKVLVKTYDCENDRAFWNLALYSCCVPGKKHSRCHCTVGGMWYSDAEIMPYENNEDKLGKPIVYNFE